MTSSILNVPDVEFPVNFRQRITSADRVYDFTLDHNDYIERATVTVARGDRTIFRTRPLFLALPLGDTLPRSEILLMALSNDDARSPSRLPKPTEETLRSGVVEIVVGLKADER